MNRVKFSVYVKTFHSCGSNSKTVAVYDLSPAEQLEAFNRAILGYDPTHPDSPGAPYLKFGVTEGPAEQPEVTP